jgi:hypothetical protein
MTGPPPDPTPSPEPARVRALFEALVELAPAERQASLAALSLQDPVLSGIVRGLLEGFEEDGRLDLLARDLESVRTASLAPPLPDGTLLGPWRVLRTLARGAWGACTWPSGQMDSSICAWPSS